MPRLNQLQTSSKQNLNNRAVVKATNVPFRSKWLKALNKSAAAVLCSTLITASPCFANSEVANFKSSGFLLKDTISVAAVEDDKVPGVVVYVSDVKRNIADRLNSNSFFSDPATASIGCAATKPIAASSIDIKSLGDKSGEELFSERLGLNLFKDKTIRVRRVYDQQNNTLLYIGYNTRNTQAADDSQSSSRYKTSICAVPLTPVTYEPGSAASLDN